ncbi:MAG: hypothetical protein WKF73_18910 [Nocardioidaceae bacterium]
MPPPAPTAANCLWSPTSSSFAPAASTWCVDRGECGGVGHRGLVDDHQVPGVQPQALVVAGRARPARPCAGGEPVLRGEPGGDVARVEALGGEDLGRDLRRGEPEHPPRNTALRAGSAGGGVGPAARDRARRRTTCRSRPARRGFRPSRRR